MFSAQIWGLIIDSNSWKENFSALYFFLQYALVHLVVKIIFCVTDKTEKVIG